MRSPKHSTGSVWSFIIFGRGGRCVFLSFWKHGHSKLMLYFSYVNPGIHSSRNPSSFTEEEFLCLFLNKVSCSPICSWTHYPARDDPELWFSRLHLPIIGLQTTPSCPTWETNLEASIWVLITRVTASMSFSWDRQNNVYLLTHVWKSSYIFCAFVMY